MTAQKSGLKLKEAPDTADIPLGIAVVLRKGEEIDRVVGFGLMMITL